MPYKRTAEFMKDVFGVSISQGTVTNLLNQFQHSAIKAYRDIQTQVFQAPVVGFDETGAKIDGTKGWFQTYQSPNILLLAIILPMGTKAQEHFIRTDYPTLF